MHKTSLIFPVQHVYIWHKNKEICCTHRAVRVIVCLLHQSLAKCISAFIEKVFKSCTYHGSLLIFHQRRGSWVNSIHDWGCLDHINPDYISNDKNHGTQARNWRSFTFSSFVILTYGRLVDEVCKKVFSEEQHYA